jgi:hypothetical protein
MGGEPMRSQKMLWQLNLEPEQHAALHEIKTRLKIPMAEIVRMGIDFAIARHRPFAGDHVACACRTKLSLSGLTLDISSVERLAQGQGWSVKNGLFSCVKCTSKESRKA